MQPTYEELLQENQALRERLNKAEIGLYRFEQIVQNMSGIFWIGHPEMDQGMLYTSPRFEEVFGYSFGQIVDVHGTVGNVIHPDDKQRFMDSQKMLFEQGKRDIDYRIIRSDGEVRYLHSHAFMIFNPEIQRQQPAGITEDITEQKLMEQALYESHQRLKLSLSGAQLGSWDWHIATGELQFNDRWATMLGYKPEEIEPSINTWERLIHPDDYDRVMKLLNTHLEGFIPHFQVEYRLRVKSGEWLWVLISGQVFERGTNNQPLRAAGIHLDISQRKKIEDQELQLFSERQRVNVLSNFIRDTSHDLKTPLSLLGTGLYLLRKIDDPERRIAKIDDLEHHLSYLIDVIEQMQKMAILDSVIELTLKPVAVNIVLDELATNTQLRAAHKGITFTYTPIPQSPRAAIHVDHLFHALTNIMDNAIQFTPVGGSVTLCARTKNDRLIIEVIDTGTGISSDFLPHIFERFFKGDSARMYRSGGAGLGLPMAKRIIELHGGQIEVESIPDVSTTFRIVLPMV